MRKYISKNKFKEIHKLIKEFGMLPREITKLVRVDAIDVSIAATVKHYGMYIYKKMKR